MRYIGLISAFCLSATLTACGDNDENIGIVPTDEILAQYGDSVLRLQDVERLLPPDISSADSVLLKRSITDQWIDGQLIEDLASNQIDDMDRIDRLTAQYRRSLIIDSYRRKIKTSAVWKVSDKAINDYYAKHQSELLLERPVIKGLFIKVPASSRYLDDIRRWMKDASAEAYDQLENIGSSETVSFRYFINNWIDFDAITEGIPYKFGDYDKFVDENIDFETENNGTIYILHLSEFRHSGELMPEEYAAPIIEDIITNRQIEDYEKDILKSLRKTAKEKKILIEGNNTQ